MVFWPCAADFKYADVAGYPDGYIDYLLLQRRHPQQRAGRSRAPAAPEEQDAHRLRRLRRRRRHPGAGQPEDAKARSSTPRTTSNPSTANPAGRRAAAHQSRPRSATLEIPRVLRPACCACRTWSRWTTSCRAARRTPTGSGRRSRRWSAGAVPERNNAVRVGCSDKSVCDECPREKRLRQDQAVPAPAPGAAGAGLVPAGAGHHLHGRGDAQRLRRAVHSTPTCPARAATAPAGNVEDQGTAMIGAIGSICSTPRRKQQARGDGGADRRSAGHLLPLHAGVEPSQRSLSRGAGGMRMTTPHVTTTERPAADQHRPGDPARRPRQDRHLPRPGRRGRRLLLPGAGAARLREVLRRPAAWRRCRGSRRASAASAPRRT